MNTAISKIVGELEAAIGARAVLTDDDALSSASYDYTEEPARRPSVVVRPTSVEDVQAIVRTAARERLALTVRVAGSNVGGLAIAPSGGIVVDLSAMNRIVAINEADMVAILEPGVTWEQLKARLEHDGLALRLGYPLSPPDTSVVANCLLDGLGNLSMRHGSMADWIGGLEVVLPDGSLARTGAGALSDVWFGRGPLPDLTGLFVNWQGTTGIVTKLAFQLWPTPPLRQRLFVPVGHRDDAFNVMRALCRRPLADDVGALSWPTGKMVLGVDKPLVRDDGEPELFLYVDMSGENGAELALRRGLLDQMLANLRQAGARLEAPLELSRLVKLSPRFAELAEFPTRLSFLVDHPGGGLSWLGTYGPMSRFEPFADAGVAIMRRYETPPILVSRPMKGGHFGVMRFITRFDRRDADARQRVREMIGELLEAGLDLGFVPYKTPPWMIPRLRPRLDAGFQRLMNTVRQALDPSGIMAPHCWPPDPALATLDG
ncbi:MAG: FAD-binding oxidoreductase [Myxococcales bacterium]|nr:FAD-binding oxidoreductase [Myxococcales bacterium]